MKNKILSFVLALCLIIPCALVFVACGDKEKEPVDTAIYVGTAAELTTAITNATATDVIKLNANIDLETAIAIDNIVTINLNGKTLTTATDVAGDGVFMVVENGKLTIEGNGIVNGVGDNPWNIGIFANGGEVIINGGTFTNVGAEDNGPDADHFDLIYAKNGGKVTINGGVFECETPAWTLNLHDGTRAESSIVVRGGSFKGFNPADNLAEGEGTNFVEDGYEVQSAEVNDATWYTVVAE